MVFCHRHLALGFGGGMKHESHESLLESESGVFHYQAHVPELCGGMKHEIQKSEREVSRHRHPVSES